MSTQLEKLRQQVKQLTQAIAPDSVPVLSRNLPQLAEQAQKLAKKKAPDDRTKTKAQYLLAPKGFDTEQIQQILNSIELKATYEPLEPIADTDLEGYLRHEHETLVLAAIEEAKKETIDGFKANYTHYMENEWDQVKRELMDYFSQTDSTVWNVGRKGDVIEPGTPSLTTMTTRGTGLTPKMAAYAQGIYMLNEHRLRNIPFGIASTFLNIASTVEHRDLQQKADIINCWALLKRVLGEENVGADGNFVGEPLLEAEYANRRMDPKIKTKFLNGARAFLEEQYVNFMNQLTRSNLKKGQLGGVPTHLSLVRAYMNILFDASTRGFPEQLEKAPDGMPMWGVIYYCLRTGRVDAAIEYASTIPTLQDFIPLLRSFGRNELLSDHSRSQLLEKYRLVSRQSRDYYKLIVHNLLGKCDPQKSHNEIHRWSTEDWMWLKLNMISTLDGDASSQHLSLTQFQKTLRDYGPNHFNNPLLYFQVLLLSLQFEHALRFLDSAGQAFHIETAHFAFTLYYYGVLNLPSQPTHQLFLEDERGVPALNVLRLLKTYVRNFAQAEPIAALHYIFLIQDIKTRHEYIKDLIIETEEYALLLGEVQPDGKRMRAHLDKFVTQEQWVEIVGLAAEAAESSGKYEDAIKLYDLGGFYENVLVLVTKQMGRVLTQTGPERSKLVELSKFIKMKYEMEVRDPQKYESFARQVSDTNFRSFVLLLGLSDFFDLYRAGNFSKALEKIKELDMLPFQSQFLEEKVNSFKHYSDSIRRNFADVLIATMDCLLRIYNAYRSSGPAMDPARESFLAGIKQEAKTLIMFSGMIQFRMPGNAHATLVKMEVAMS